jgi:hypothetical protein
VVHSDSQVRSNPLMKKQECRRRDNPALDLVHLYRPDRKVID